MGGLDATVAILPALSGAPCTVELKVNSAACFSDVQPTFMSFGYTADPEDVNRAESICSETYPELDLYMHL